MDLEQISYRKVNSSVPFGHIISESGLNKLRSNLENGWIIISTDNTDLSDSELESEIKNSGYSYSRVYGVNDSYKPSFIVYCKDRNGELIDFEDLFEFGVKLCKKFFQNSVYIQPPGEKPYYVDKNGRAISRPGPNQIKYNRFEEEFFTTAKRKKNNSQRFTADIKFESLRVKRLSNFERMKARQYGEIVLD